MLHRLNRCLTFLKRRSSFRYATRLQRTNDMHHFRDDTVIETTIVELSLERTRRTESDCLRVV